MGRTGFGMALGCASFIVAAELLFRLLPVSTTTATGYYVDPLILGYPAHHQWQVSTGWDLRNPQRLQSNALGFASEREFSPDANAVALVGDSYVESSMLPSADRPDLQLERALGGRRPVYAFGAPGTAALDYAERIRFAAQRFGIRDVVMIMEAGDLRQALCDSGNVHAVCLDPASLQRRVQTLPPPSWAKRALRHSALLQYVTSQLKADPAKLVASLWTRQTVGSSAEPALAPDGGEQGTLPPARRRMVDAVADRFFSRLDSAAPAVRLVVVALASTGDDHLLSPALRAERARFIERLEARGVDVVDAEMLFSEHRRRSARALAVGPYDAHLNSEGVRLITEAAAERLTARR